MTADEKVLNALREGTLHLINFNPSTIVVQRVEYAADGAGGRIPLGPAAQPPFVGRLQPIINNRQEDSLAEDAGVEQRATHALICPHSASIAASSEVQDAFTLQGVTYEVQRVVIRNYKGQPYKVTAALQVVS